MTGSPPPKDVVVKVHLHPSEDPPFHLECADLPTGPDGEYIFANNRHPGFHIHFVLQDPTHGYFFPPNNNKAQAVWSEFGDGACPESQIWDVFRALNVSADRKTLVVRNANTHPELGKFGYTLRVVKGADDWLELDPGGDNQNGPIRSFDWSYVLVGVGSAIATTATIALAVSLSGYQMFCPNP
jgi:hypothetical protein